MCIAIVSPIETATFRRHLMLKLDAPVGDRLTLIGPLACGMVQLGHDVHMATLDLEVAQPVQISEGMMLPFLS